MIISKPKRIGLGFMSGTSLDGMDAALVEIEGAGHSTKLRLLEFLTQSYSASLRSTLLDVVMGETGGSRLLCSLDVLLGEIAAEAGLELCRKAGFTPAEVDFAGSHGQTVYHLPDPVCMEDRLIRGTLQIGEGSIIAEKIGCPVVSDFRVRDMAAGGQGAPLVPYTEYLLYQQKDKTIALQNIGGIANITILPAGGGAADILAFDTGPGNMLIDAFALALTGKPWDEGGGLAHAGQVDKKLLETMLASDADYLKKGPPKSTGRERYNAEYVQRLLRNASEWGLSTNNTLATVTWYTAKTIALGLEQFCSSPPAELYVSGGGVHNETLMDYIQELLPFCAVQRGDVLGIPADAKEAVAFAVLAHETLHGFCNNAPAATGAGRPVVMGKISL